MRNFFHITAFLGFLLTFGLLLMIGFWMIYPYRPIKFNKTPLPVKNANHQVKQGDILQYETDYCKYNAIIPTVSKIFKDDIIYNTPSTLVLAKEPGCRDTIVGLEIPKALPPGKYTLEVNYAYPVNPIRNVHVVVNTETFFVVQ